MLIYGAHVPTLLQTYPMKVGLEYHCLRGLAKNTNVYKNSSRFQVVGRIRSEFQSL